MASVEEVSDKRGINTPLFVAFISNWALAFGVGVPMPTWLYVDKLTSLQAISSRSIFFMIFYLCVNTLVSLLSSYFTAIVSLSFCLAASTFNCSRLSAISFC